MADTIEITREWGRRQEVEAVLVVKTGGVLAVCEAADFAVVHTGSGYLWPCGFATVDDAYDWALRLWDRLTPTEQMQLRTSRTAAAAATFTATAWQQLQSSRLVASLETETAG